MNKYFSIGLLIILAAGGFFVWQQKSSSAVTAVYTSPLGYSIRIPAGATAKEIPSTSTLVASTEIEGTFGHLCVSPGYGCGGKGESEPVSQTTKMITAASGQVLSVDESTYPDRLVLAVLSIKSLPSAPWTDQFQIRLETTAGSLATAETLLASLSFKK